MKGHIRERSPGHWAIVIDVSDPQTGQRKRRWYSFQGTKRAAQSECARLLAAQEAGTAVEPSRLTVTAYLGKWLDHVRPQVSPRTIERYAEIAAEYLAPALGHVWTAPPWQELSDLLQHWSGAVMCPACLAGCEAAGHNALRGSGPNQKHAFKDALTQAGSPDPRIDLVCITSSCPRQFLQNVKRRRRCLASPP